MKRIVYLLFTIISMGLIPGLHASSYTRRRQQAQPSTRLRKQIAQQTSRRVPVRQQPVRQATRQTAVGRRVQPTRQPVRQTQRAQVRTTQSTAQRRAPTAGRTTRTQPARRVSGRGGTAATPYIAPVVAAPYVAPVISQPVTPIVQQPTIPVVTAQDRPPRHSLDEVVYKKGSNVPTLDQLARTLRDEAINAGIDLKAGQLETINDWINKYPTLIYLIAQIRGGRIALAFDAYLNRWSPEEQKLIIPVLIALLSKIDSEAMKGSVGKWDTIKEIARSEIWDFYELLKYLREIQNKLPRPTVATQQSGYAKEEQPASIVKPWTLQSPFKDWIPQIRNWRQKVRETINALEPLSAQILKNPPRTYEQWQREYSVFIDALRNTNLQMLLQGISPHNKRAIIECIKLLITTALHEDRADELFSTSKEESEKILIPQWQAWIREVEAPAVIEIY